MAKRRMLPPTLTGTSFAVADALELGVTRGALRHGDLARPFRGVRADLPGSLTLVDSCRAYLSHDPDAVFSHVTAARLWQLPLPARWERDPALHVLDLSATRAARGLGVVGHKTARDPETTSVSGVRVTGPIATWLSLGPMLPVDDLIAAGDRLLDWREPLTDLDSVRAEVARTGGTRGIRAVRQALEELRPGTRSPRETRVRLAIVRAGLPEPELNARVVLASGYAFHGDLVYRSERIVFEYDSDHHRTDDRQWARDLDRYNELSAAGWIVVRIAKAHSDSDVVRAARRARARRSGTT